MICPRNYSWSWRKILGLRSLIRRFICYRIGDGCSTSLWFDNWHPGGHLVKVFGDKIIIDSGLGREARLSCIIAGQE